MNAAPELEDDVVEAPKPAPQRGLLVRLRHYAWDWRAVVAVGIATFIVGGLAGLVMGLSMDHGNNSERGGRFGPGGQFRPGGFPGGQGFGVQSPDSQMPGQGFGPGNGQPPNGR
ncbi:MAG TPA: hypothetical protein VN108_09805 [Marmoricola sp.]|nr:hypothetical protein [Marmoricola sp.]